MRKDAQDFNHLDVDRFPQPAVDLSSSDETVDPSRSNADGEHDAADNVEGRRPRSRPPRGPSPSAPSAGPIYRNSPRLRNHLGAGRSRIPRFLVIVNSHGDS